MTKRSVVGALIALVTLVGVPLSAATGCASSCAGTVVRVTSNDSGTVTLRVHQRLAGNESDFCTVTRNGSDVRGCDVGSPYPGCESK